MTFYSIFHILVGFMKLVVDSDVGERVRALSGLGFNPVSSNLDPKSYPGRCLAEPNSQEMSSEP